MDGMATQPAAIRGRVPPWRNTCGAEGGEEKAAQRPRASCFGVPTRGELKKGKTLENSAQRLSYPYNAFSTRAFRPKVYCPLALVWNCFPNHSVKAGGVHSHKIK